MAVADQGEGPGGAAPPPLVLDQIEAQLFFETAPPLSKGLDDAPPAPFIWSSGSASEWGGGGT